MHRYQLSPILWGLFLGMALFLNFSDLLPSEACPSACIASEREEWAPPQILKPLHIYPGQSSAVVLYVKNRE